MARQTKKRNNTTPYRKKNGKPSETVNDANPEVQPPQSQPQPEQPLLIDYNTNFILGKLIEKLEIKDMINMNSVCRQWHQATNPRIYSSLKFVRDGYDQHPYYTRSKSQDILAAKEIQACIEHNSKYLHLVQGITLDIPIKALSAKDFFSTFCHLTRLTICKVCINEELLLNCLRPLNQLAYLRLDTIFLNEFKGHDSELEVVKLPPSLTKLEIINVNLVGDCILIIDTLNTHSNIEEFVAMNGKGITFINPFMINYSTLKKFQLGKRYGSELSEAMCLIVESNPQLTELYYYTFSLNKELLIAINSKLVNLKVLYLKATQFRPTQFINVKWTQRMNLTSLTIHSNDLSIESYSSILTNVGTPSELSIFINDHYNSLTSIIQQNYPSLKHLTYYTHRHYYNSNSPNVDEQFFKDEFNKSQYICSNNLKSLNFGYLNLLELRPEYLNSFPNLEVVRFINIRPFGMNSQTFQAFERHLQQFKGWKFELETECNASRGSLYRPGTKCTIQNLEKNY